MTFDFAKLHVLVTDLDLVISLTSQAQMIVRVVLYQAPIYQSDLRCVFKKGC